MQKLPPAKNTRLILLLLTFFTIYKNAASQPVPDSNIIKTYIQTCIDSVTADPVFTEQLANRIVYESNSIKYPWGVFMGTTILGAVACNNGEYDHAARLHEIALSYGRFYGFRQKESVTLGNLAKDYLGKGDHKKAIDLYLEAAKVAQEINDTVQLGQALQGVGQTYNKLGYSAEAIRYCSQAVEIFKKYNRYNSLRWAYNNIASAYIDSGRADSAHKYMWLCKEAYDMATGGAPAPLDFYINLAVISDSLRRPDSAAYYFAKAIETGRHAKTDAGMEHPLFYVGNKAEQAGDYRKALGYYKEALELAKKYNNMEGKIKTAGSLASLYARMGDYANAYQYSLQTASFNDSYLNGEKIKAVAAQNTRFEKQLLKYEFEKKTAAAQLANQQKIARRNMLLYYFIGLAILLLTGIVFLVKYFRQKAVISANRNNELKQQLLLTQMNPHFIFNSVDNIQGLIHSKQPEAAISYLTKFSKLTRQILENSRENYITLEEELNMLDNYLMIQQLLYNNKFAYSIRADEAIDTTAILLPPMLTQPFIENAIRHGLKNKREGGMVKVRFYMEAGRLLFEVTDNGTGLTIKDNENGQRSLSTQITRERLQSLRPKDHAGISTTDITTGNVVTGVKTFFEIPYIHNN